MNFVSLKKTAVFLIAISFFLTIKTTGSDSRFNTDPSISISTCDCDCGLLLRNFSGINHDEETNNYWTHPLTVDKNNSDYDTVSCIRLKGNIIYKPTKSSCSGNDNLAAIIIDKDNITLDLSGFSLSLDSSNFSGSATAPSCSTSPCPSIPPTNCTPEVHGILVKSGVKNLKIISSEDIRHSTIKGFTGFGIKLDGTNHITDIKNIYIYNIKISECYKGGILAQNSSSLEIDKTETKHNCSYESIYGMKFVNVKDLIVQNSKANMNTSCNNAYGIYMEDTILSSIVNCESSGNQSFSTSGEGSAYGIYCTATTDESSYNNHFNKCTASSNICADTTISEVVGIMLCSTDSGDHEGTARNTIEECIISSNNFPGTVSPPSAFGIKLDHSNFNKIVKNVVGCNGTRTVDPSTNSCGIIDTLNDPIPPVKGSTSYFMQNFSYFNGHLGDNNYSIEYKRHKSKLESFKSIIIFPSEYEPLATAHPMANIELRKS